MKRPYGSTTVELVEVLRSLEQTPGVHRILRRAEVGHYHDYLTDAACPKVELVNDLLAEGLGDLASKVMRGEYDEDPDDRRLPRVED